MLTRAITISVGRFASLLVATSYAACITGSGVDPATTTDLDMGELRSLAAPDLPSPADLPLPPAPDLAPPPPELVLPQPGGPSLCASASAAFCEGFEDANSIWGSFGTVAFDQQHVFRGASSFHASGARSLTVWPQTLKGTDLYLRAFVYLPSPMPTAKLTFLRFQQSTGNQFAIDLQLANGRFQTTATRTGAVEASVLGAPLDAWFCAEWHVNLDSNGYAALSVDAVPVAGLNAENHFDTSNNSPYDWLVLGIDTGASGATVPALFLDEVIVDDKPIGCTR
jgi:hypothetical protein